MGNDDDYGIDLECAWVDEQTIDTMKLVSFFFFLLLIFFLSSILNNNDRLRFDIVAVQFRISPSPKETGPSLEVSGLSVDSDRVMGHRARAVSH